MLTMDTNDMLDFLRSAMRSIGAEVTSPWFYLQFGGRDEVRFDILDSRPRRHGQCEGRRDAGTTGCIQARGHPRALPGARNPGPRRRASGREYRSGGSGTV